MQKIKEPVSAITKQEMFFIQAVFTDGEFTSTFVFLVLSDKKCIIIRSQLN